MDYPREAGKSTGFSCIFEAINTKQTPKRFFQAKRKSQKSSVHADYWPLNSWEGVTKLLSAGLMLFEKISLAQKSKRALNKMRITGSE